MSRSGSNSSSGKTTKMLDIRPDSSPEKNSETLYKLLLESEFKNYSLVNIEKLVKKSNLKKTFGTSNKTLLHLAVFHDNFDMTVLLVKHGASIKCKDNYKKLPRYYIELSCNQTKKDNYELLLNPIFTPYKTLRDLCEMTTVSKASLDKVLTKRKLFNIEENLSSTLFSAIEYGNIPLTQFILENSESKIDLDQYFVDESHERKTYLSQALQTKNRNPKIVELLLSHNADMLITSVMPSTYHSDLSAIKAIFQSYANISVFMRFLLSYDPTKESAGLNVFFHIGKVTNDTITDENLEKIYKESKNEQEDLDEALEYAVMPCPKRIGPQSSARVSLLKKLIDLKADITQKSPDGENILFTAIGTSDNRGYASNNGIMQYDNISEPEKDIIEYLISDCHISPHEPNASGLTPYRWAKKIWLKPVTKNNSELKDITQHQVVSYIAAYPFFSAQNYLSDCLAKNISPDLTKAKSLFTAAKLSKINFDQSIRTNLIFKILEQTPFPDDWEDSLRWLLQKKSTTNERKMPESETQFKDEVDLNAQGKSILSCALKKADFKIIDIFLASGVDVTKNKPHLVLDKKHHETYINLLTKYPKNLSLVSFIYICVELDSIPTKLQIDTFLGNATHEENFAAFLHIASLGKPYHQAMDLLIEHELSVADKHPTTGDTVLHCAANATDPDPDIIKKLLEKKADPNCLNKQNKTPRYLLREKETIDLSLFPELLHSKKNLYHLINEIALEKRVPTQADFEQIISKEPTFVDHAGNNALHIATIKGYHIAVNYLLEKELIDINAKNYKGYTPLVCAILEKNASMVAELLKYSTIDINAIDGTGKTALAHAELQKDESIIQLLKAYKPTLKAEKITIAPDSKSEIDLTPSVKLKPGEDLSRLIRTIHTLQADLADRKFANLKKEYFALLEDTVSAVQEDKLLHVDADGNNAIHLAALLGLTSQFSGLIEAFPHLANVKNNKGQTALMLAIQAKIDIDPDFLSKFFDIAIKDNEGQSAYHYAEKETNSKLITWLYRPSASSQALEPCAPHEDERQEYLRNLKKALDAIHHYSFPDAIKIIATILNYMKVNIMQKEEQKIVLQAIPDNIKKHADLFNQIISIKDERLLILYKLALDPDTIAPTISHEEAKTSIIPSIIKKEEDDDDFLFVETEDAKEKQTLTPAQTVFKLFALNDRELLSSQQDDYKQYPFKARLLSAYLKLNVSENTKKIASELLQAFATKDLNQLAKFIQEKSSFEKYKPFIMLADSYISELLNPECQLFNSHLAKAQEYWQQSLDCQYPEKMEHLQNMIAAYKDATKEISVSINEIEKITKMPAAKKLKAKTNYSPELFSTASQTTAVVNSDEKPKFIKERGA